MQSNNVLNELGTNFIEYAVAVNTDRAIPNAKDGLKPVAKRILYGTFDQGFKNDKPHVKCANIVGNVMADWHPHGDSSIYGALCRLSQKWVMRYPLIDFHGANGNIDGDEPAAYRYTEARLAKLTEEGMLVGIKKNNVDFVPNYSETKDEPVDLPAIFPNLLCNPNSGIGVAMACSWAPHNLREVAQAIYDVIDGKEPMLPGPDFPTGGIVINKDDIPGIMKTGHGSVKIRARHQFEKQNIVFTELPYGIATEALMTQIGELCDSGDLVGIEDIRNESNKKGFRLVIECEKGAQLGNILQKLFLKTNLQTSFSYNQVALIGKTPTELNLKQCIDVYLKHNQNCIIRETEFDKNKVSAKLEVINGLLRALEDIDNIIALIKASASAAAAQKELIAKYQFTEPQAHAIVEMKLGRLAGLEKVELNQDKADLEKELERLGLILANPIAELRTRLETLVTKFGDDRRTELAQIEVPKEEKEIAYVEPEKVVVVMTEGGLIKRIPATSFRTQKRNGKGIKTQNDITSGIIRTNTIDQLMIFSDKGKMYRLLVDNIPVGTNATDGTPVKALVEMEQNENPTVIYSIYRDTDAQYVLFTTKNGLVKKTALDEYVKTKKKTGIAAISLKEDDELVSVNLVKDEQIMLITAQGYAIRFSSTEVGASGRTTAGVKGMNLNDGDSIVATLVIRHADDDLALFAENGLCKKCSLSEFTPQKRAGKGVICYKTAPTTGNVVAATLVVDEDMILVVGDKSSICVTAKEIPALSRVSAGNYIIKNSKVKSVSKV